MTTVRFRALDGSVRAIESPDGESLMRVAVNNDIPDIVGECGGEISCATCHVYLPANIFDEVSPMSQDEADLLEVMDNNRENSSRLGCQVHVSSILAGVEIEVAPDNE